MIIVPPHCRPEVGSMLTDFDWGDPAPAPDAWLQPWVDRLTGDPPQPTLLPRRFADRVVWYALAFDDRQFQELGEDLGAFIGPAFSTFRGRPFESPGDATDQRIATVTGGRMFGFEAGSAPESELRAALGRLLASWDSRPATVGAFVPHVARLTREFDMAVLAGHRLDAEAALDQLRTSGQLTAENLLFLRVRLEAALGGSERVLALEDLPELLRLRRPPDVTAALIAAVYTQELARFEQADDAEGAARHFAGVVIPRFRDLYANRAGLSDLASLKSFMLMAVIYSPANAELREELLQFTEIPPGDYLYLKKLAGLFEIPPAPETTPPVDPLTAARSAAENGDFDRAFSLASTLLVGVEKSKLLCRCAYEVGTLEMKTAAIAAVNALPETDRGWLRATRAARDTWAVIQSTDAPPTTVQPQVELAPAAAAMPGNWSEWFDLLVDADGRNRARKLARQGASEWSVDTLRDDPAAINALADRLRFPPGDATEIVLECLPHLLMFLGCVRPPAAVFRPLYRATLDLLYAASSRSTSELAVFTETLDVVLTMGTNAEEYSVLVGYALELWRMDRAPGLVEWLMELADVLVFRPAHNVELRREIIEELLAALSRSAHRFGREEQDLVRRIAEEAGEVAQAVALLPPPSAVPASDPMGTLASMTVAIHTLTEGAARTAADVLNRNYPGVRVTLLHDYDCSKRLQQYSRQADLFIMVTWSTKHAATDCIETHRPKGMPLLRPDGRGSSTILRSIREQLGG